MNLARGVIRVCRGWDAFEGEITTKTGRDRTVPIAAVLRDYLDEHLIGLDWQEGLVFGVTASYPFEPTGRRQAERSAFAAAKLESITPHECRHTFASPRARRYREADDGEAREP